MDKKKEYRFLDKNSSQAIKGICAIIVMLGHYDVCGLFTNVACVLVGIFFFYSGYGLKYNLDNKENYLDYFIGKKIMTLYLPFLIAESSETIIKCIQMQSPIVSVHTALSCMGVFLSNGSLWYVIELLVLNLLFYLIYKCKIQEIIWMILYILFMLLAVRFDVGTWWYISTICFLIGIYYEKLKWIMAYVFSNTFPKILLSCLAIMLYMSGEYVSRISIWKFSIITRNHLCVAIQLLFVPVGMFFCWMLTEYIDPKNRLTTFVGKISYEIYLWHMGVFVVISELLPAQEILRGGVSACVTILVAWGMNYLMNCVRKMSLLQF